MAALLTALPLRSISTVNYTAKNGLVGNTVRKIFVDDAHRIWLGTENGFSVLTSKGLTNMVFDPHWPLNIIWEIYEAPDSTLWFGMLHHIVSKRPDGGFQTLPQQDLAYGLIRRFRYHDNQLLIGSDRGLFALDYTTKKPVHYQSKDSDGRFQVMNFFSVDSCLYFQTYQHSFSLLSD